MRDEKITGMLNAVTVATSNTTRRLVGARDDQGAHRGSAYMTHVSGRHFLQIPGPTNIPERILHAVGRPTIDHRGPEFASLAADVAQGTSGLLNTRHPVVFYPSSGHGAWEAALANALSPGDGVVICETGYFASLWGGVAERIGLKVQTIASDWRQRADTEQIQACLEADRGGHIKAVCVVHSETSTGVVTCVDSVRRAMDAARHPALLMVDTISSLGCMDYQMDEWGVDVTVGASQKGLMLPPGLAFNAVSDRALMASRRARTPRSYWDWQHMLAGSRHGDFPYTPATNLMFGLREALAMLNEEGLDAVFARHDRHAAATRTAVDAWGLEVWCQDPLAHSSSVTAVGTPPGCDADELRDIILQRYDMSLGSGLGSSAGKLFRIGHLGSFNDLMLAGALAGVEMGLRVAGVAHRAGGVQAALDYLTDCAAPSRQQVVIG